MARVTFIEFDGSSHIVDAQEGCSLMEAAARAGVPGILADCGGECACGTCRVYVDPAWQERVGDSSDMEDAILELDESMDAGRRLACQVVVSPELHGLVVRLPESQF